MWSACYVQISSKMSKAAPSVGRGSSIVKGRAASKSALALGFYADAVCLLLWR